jgi:fermentation-respiration switch protein FrsA (DUF1100 family)
MAPPFNGIKGYWLRLGLFTLAATSVAFIFLTVALAYLQFQVFVIPQRNLVTKTPADVGLTFQSLSLQTEDGLQLASWYIPGRRPTAIILIHGINGNREAMLPTATILAAAGYPLLLIDLRGHGESEGDRVSYGYYEARDVQAGVAFLAQQSDVTNIAALGTSLGGSAIIHAAAYEPRINAIIAQSTFSSLSHAIDDGFDDRSIFPRWPFAPLFIFLAEKYLSVTVDQVNSAQVLHNVAPRPVLIIHGRQDDLFPVEHAERLYQAASEPKRLWIIEGLGHGDPALEQRDLYQHRLLDFLATVDQTTDQ